MLALLLMILGATIRAGNGIYAEADVSEPRTLEDLADARRRFLSSVDFFPVEADLPAVLLSEG